MSALGLMLLAAAPSYAAPVVTSGFQPDATEYGAVRWRNFANFAGDKEIRIGNTPLTPGGTFNTGDFTWNNPGATTVHFSYDGTDTITTSVGGGPVTVSYTLSPPGAPVNYLLIELCNSSQSRVALNSVSLDGVNLGNFGFPSGCQAWSVINIDKSAGFDLEASIQFQHLQSGQDQSLVQVTLGHYSPSSGTAPGVSNVLVTPAPLPLGSTATVTATVDDSGSTRGNNLIESAEYSVNGNGWSPADAQDGGFDEINEDVQAEFAAAQIGANEVCVRGTDSLGNISDSTCQSFTVSYEFDGFYPPVDNLSMNVAKAGAAVPFKWRLTDGSGNPVSNPSFFAGLWSYPIGCSDMLGTPTDAVEEYAPGNSALQYLDDGYWQFNWKTPKTYANKCYAAYVLFNDGVSTSPIVTFKFKK